LVNSLLMLIEQRSEDGIIRYYAPEDEDSYAQAVRAKREVQNDTVLGSYLLSGMSVSFAESDGYCTLTYSMTYRSGTQNVSSLMALTDSQSLMDLLRLAMREEHSSITAQFISKTSREEVLNVVEQLWQELYLDELEQSGTLLPPDPPTETPPAEGEEPQEGGEESPPSDETTPDEENSSSSETVPTGNSETDGETDSENDGESESDTSGDGSEEGTSESPDEEPSVQRIQFPPCPWEIRFYPDADFPEIVEIILK